MEEILIDATQSTPAIRTDFEAGMLSMHGDSYPENSFELFEPVLKWVEHFLADTERPLSLELRLLYLNTSSIKAMMDLFDMLEDAHGRGRAVQVTWYYDPQNERVAELAAEFKEDCSFPFSIVAREG